VGAPAGTGDFREAAWRLPPPFTAVRTVGPDQAVHLGLPAEPRPAAYVCAGTTCGAPVRSATELRAAYESVAER
jgi:uncharacterized protein YyaL (SSP411 family)